MFIGSVQGLAITLAGPPTQAAQRQKPIPIRCSVKRKEQASDMTIDTTPLREEQMQGERIVRAQEALQNGEMQVFPVNGSTWTVASKGNRYTVSQDGTVWACTCPDFTGRCQRFHLKCKHIGAVCITEIGQRLFPQEISSISLTNMEENMPRSTQSEPTVQTDSDLSPPQNLSFTDQLIARLRQPLDMNRVKRRQSSGQATVPYLEGYSVIEAANDLFEFRWSFDLAGEPRIMRWDKLVTTYDSRTRKKSPILGEDGRPLTEPVGVVYITGRIEIELDDKPYGHADVGRCTFTGDTPEALDMAIAGAATDCLKRCFRQLGEQFGLTLYDKEIAKTAGLDFPQGSGESAHRRNGNGSQPPAAATETSIKATYRDGTAVDANNAAELTAFQAYTAAHNGQVPISRDALRIWLSNQNGTKK